jgi:hypothetical protein
MRHGGPPTPAEGSAEVTPPAASKGSISEDTSSAPPETAGAAKNIGQKNTPEKTPQANPSPPVESADPSSGRNADKQPDGAATESNAVDTDSMEVIGQERGKK